MAVLKQRLHRKNSSGSYDIVYLENIATNIKMSDSDTTLLSTKISSMDTAIAGKQPAGSYAAANHNHNGVYQPVGNYQPAGSYAAANHSHNGANLSYDSTRSINDVINSNYSMIVNANNEISSLKSSVSSGKAQIASAITDKGVSTATSASFSQMASNIRNINQGLSARYIVDYHFGGSSTTYGEYNVSGYFIYNTAYDDYNTLAFINPIRRFNKITLDYPRFDSGSVSLALYINGSLVNAYSYYRPKGGINVPNRVPTHVLFIESISDTDKQIFINNGFIFYDFTI